MKNLIEYIFSIFLLLVTFQSVSAQNPVFFGSAEEDIANAIVQYNLNFYIFGTTRKTNKSSTDYFLLQLNESGAIKNKLIFGGPHGDYGKDVIANSNGIFLLGKTWDGGLPNNDMFLHRLDTTGNLLWSKFYGTEKNDQGHGFISTADGGFAMVGHNRGVDDFGDVYLVKTDEDGQLLWETHFGDSYIDHGFDVVETDSGDLIVVGTKGGFYNPTTVDYHNHDADIFVIKTNASGEKIWEKTFGGTSHDWAKKIIAAPGGGYFLCGSSQNGGGGSFDMFLMKMDGDGNGLWTKYYGGPQFEYGESVGITVDNHLLLLATSASFSGNYKPDHFLVKTDLEGETIWQKTFGGEASDYSSSMVCTTDSGCVFTGYSNGGELGKNDIVLYKITKNGDASLLSSIPTMNDTIEQIRIFPNPVRNGFSVIIDTKLTSAFELRIFNTQGALVYEDLVEPNVQGFYRPQLSQGLYLFTVRNKSGRVYSGKLIFE